MNQRRRALRLFATMTVLAVVLVACGDDGDSGDSGGNGDGGLSGTIVIDGSSTVAPLSEAAAELFQEEYPDVRITVGTSGTGGGFEKFCIGETDMSDASRPIEDDEIAACEANDITFDAITVANDALSVVVNPDNPVDCMTVEQLNQVWAADSTVSTWGEIDGLDLPADFASQELDLVGPGTDSGTFDFFTEAINGEEGSIRTTYTDIGEDDQAAVNTVQGDEGAMGYIPYSFVTQAGDSVKALEIDGGEGCVAPTLENVQAGTYVPLGRPLFVYASGTALEKEHVLAFMKFYIENAEAVAEAASYVPLTEEQMTEQLDKIDQLTGS
jgi:phosphate transport system substrate-binding protein